MHLWPHHDPITYPENGSWNWVSLVVRDAPTEEMGGVSGGCRWEGDSLVFRVTNQQPYLLWTMA